MYSTRVPAVYYKYNGDFLSFKKRYEVDKLGNVYGRNGKLLKTTRGVTICLKDDNDTNFSCTIARLVLSSFIGNPGANMQADHKEEEKWLDHSLDNLQWLTPHQNVKKQRPDIRDPISGIPIIRIDNDGNTECFVSANSAEQITGVPRGHISRSCREGGNAGGFKWIYDISKLNQTILDDEEWKPVVNQDGTSYGICPNIEVSNKNRIRFTKPVLRIYDIADLLTERDIERKNRPNITIQNKRRWVAELICTTFNGPKSPDDEVVRHLDDEYMNCTPENLKWGTYKENTQDLINNGKSTSKKVFIDDIEFQSATAAAEYVGVSFALLCSMIRDEGRTTFKLEEFKKKPVYIINDKRIRSLKNAAEELSVCVTTVQKMIKAGDVQVEYISIKEYNAL